MLNSAVERHGQDRVKESLTPGAGSCLEHQEHVKNAPLALDAPVRALVTARTYGGGVVALELEVARRSGTWLCVGQSASG